jgi:hypothetical protein
MRLFFLTLIITLATTCLIRADQTVVDALHQDDLSFFFANIQVAEGKLIFTRSKQDLSFHVQIGTDPKTDSPPGSTFDLPYGVAGRLFNGESNLKFIPPAPKAYPKMFLVESVNRRGDVSVGVLRVIPTPNGGQIEVLPGHVTDKGAVFTLEKDWVLGNGTNTYPPSPESGQ